MKLDTFIDSLTDDEISELIIILNKRGLLSQNNVNGLNKPFKQWFIENELLMPTRIKSAFEYEGNQKKLLDRTIGQVANQKFLMKLRYCGAGSVVDFFNTFPELKKLK